MTRLSEILVVVPALNEARHIVDCLTALLQGDPALAVVVADGGSTDQTRALVTGLRARSAARHAGGEAVGRWRGRGLPF